MDVINHITSELMKIKRLQRQNSFEDIMNKNEQEYWQEIIHQKKKSIESIQNEANQLKKELAQVEKNSQQIENGINLYQQVSDEIEKLVLSLGNVADLKEIKNLIEIRNNVYIKENQEFELALKDLDDMETSIEQMKEEFKMQQTILEKLITQYDQNNLIFNFIQKKHEEMNKLAEAKYQEKEVHKKICEQKKTNITKLKKNLEVYEPWLDKIQDKLKNFNLKFFQAKDEISGKLLDYNEKLKTFLIETANENLKNELTLRLTLYEKKKEELAKEEMKIENEKENDNTTQYETFQAMKDTSALLVWKEINQAVLLDKEISVLELDLEKLTNENQNFLNDLSQKKQTLKELELKNKEINSQKLKELEITNENIWINEEEKSKLIKNIEQIKKCNQDLIETLNNLNESWIKKQKNEMQIAKMLRKK